MQQEQILSNMTSKKKIELGCSHVPSMGRVSVYSRTNSYSGRNHSLEEVPHRIEADANGALLEIFHRQFSKILMDIVQSTLRIQKNRRCLLSDCSLIKKSLTDLESCCRSTFSKSILSETECSFEILYCLSSNMLSHLKTHVFRIATKERSIGILGEYKCLFTLSSHQKWIDSLLNAFHKMEVESLLIDNRKHANAKNEKSIPEYCKTFLQWFTGKINSGPTWPMKEDDIKKEYSIIESHIPSQVYSDQMIHADLVEEFRNLLFRARDKETSHLVSDFHSTAFSKGRMILIQIITNVDTLPAKKKNIALVCQKMSLALYECLDKHNIDVPKYLT
ncbi:MULTISPECIES: hypothetical protein [Candidatus Ichthyocystis]|nr:MULTISPECIES: hypothetical protein [Ichthyocystis]